MSPAAARQSYNMIATPAPVQQELITVSAIYFAPEEGKRSFPDRRTFGSPLQIRRALKNYPHTVPATRHIIPRHMPVSTGAAILHRRHA